ncbi:MAG TPA: triose-phosphate isomerase [Solirubrobacterales bacterium]|nr:triose-phosphate isomerase [Solirubrobacterales bacterium]
MSERVPVVAANWKMHMTIADAERFLTAFLPRVGDVRGTEIVLCPPYLALKAVVELCLQSRIKVAAQNMHEEHQGAFTGEVAAPMLNEIGVRGVVLGHSERRTYFCETDEALARKVPAALDAGLEPILCVGETETQRDADATGEVLRRQLEADLAAVPDEQLVEVVIAYEPVWAIGTGRTATPEQADDAIGFARAVVAERSKSAADEIRILYGGSVKPDNAGELMGRPHIDGALVGGASLDPEAFVDIVLAAS